MDLLYFIFFLVRLLLPFLYPGHPNRPPTQPNPTHAFLINQIQFEKKLNYLSVIFGKKIGPHTCHAGGRLPGSMEAIPPGIHASSHPLLRGYVRGPTRGRRHGHLWE
jgi:hypothetical protein